MLLIRIRKRLGEILSVCLTTEDGREIQLVEDEDYEIDDEYDEEPDEAIDPSLLSYLDLFNDDEDCEDEY